ncbi:MAG: GAF and ANTAR domain-containing protein [Antricoccus sp.]
MLAPDLYVAQRFAEITQVLAKYENTQETLQGIVDLGVSIIPGAEAGGITDLRGDRFRSLAIVGELPKLVDAIQYDLRSGPCVDAALEDTHFMSNDLAHDERWPRFGQRATTETAVRSMLSYRLYSEVADEHSSALNFYSTKLSAFDEESRVLALVFATHAGLALTAARHKAKMLNLRQALASNRQIGAAIGVLMTRLLITEQEAFDLMRIVSQDRNLKLTAVAESVLQTGEISIPGSSRLTETSASAAKSAARRPLAGQH